MFFVSEEFLRKYQEEGEINQTIGEAVPLGEELFDSTGGKRKHNEKRRQQSRGRTPKDSKNP
jgi:hypothetical protein